MMKQGNKLKRSGLLIFILTAGVFGIINTEMGVIGILPLIAETFHVTVPQAGWTVSVFALVVAATIVFVPSMPVRERLSYGTQLSVLKKKITWYSIAAVTLINGALFGFFSYMSDFLQRVTGVSYTVISTLLLVYGLANIVGNVIAGKQLARSPMRSMAAVPLALLGFYVCLFFLGEWLAAMALIILALGIMAGYGQNTMQYMIAHAAPEAPDFANGLYLLSANLGTTVGAVVCGAFITALDTRYSVFGSLLFLVVGIVFVALRMRAAAPGKQQLKMAYADLQETI